MLKSPDLAGKYELVADACGVSIGAVLMQDGRPCAFHSRKLHAPELNYTVTEQEMLALIVALKMWRCYLEAQPKERFLLVTDHNPLIHLPKQPTLSRRMARWSEYLSRCNFLWQYRPGRHNVADPVSRRPHPVVPDAAHLYVVTFSCAANSKPAADVQPMELHQVEPSSPTVQEGQAPDTPVCIGEDHAQAFKKLIIEGYSIDPWFQDTSNVASLRNSSDLWWHEGSIAVPDHANLRKKLL